MKKNFFYLVTMAMAVFLFLTACGGGGGGGGAGGGTTTLIVTIETPSDGLGTPTNRILIQSPDQIKPIFVYKMEDGIQVYTDADFSVQCNDVIDGNVPYPFDSVSFDQLLAFAGEIDGVDVDCVISASGDPDLTGLELDAYLRVEYDPGYVKPIPEIISIAVNNGIVTGTVRDVNSLNPIMNEAVIIDGGGGDIRRTTTSSSGTFSLEGGSGDTLKVILYDKVIGIPFPVEDPSPGFVVP